MFKDKTVINYKVVTTNTILILLIGYFFYHSLNGERGVFAYFRLKKTFNEQLITAKALLQERIKLETTIKYLHPNSLNNDYLDELARRELGLVGADEKILYLNK